MTDLCQLSVEPARIALKRRGWAFDIAGGMRTQELKRRVQRADYVVDPAAVAAAMLRHAVSHRRWWNPRTVCTTPPAKNTASGGPASTSPIQVSDAADSISERMSGAAQMHSS